MFDIFDRPPADPTRFFLACSPWPMVLIVSFYLFFVLKLGRQFMAKRTPYDLRVVLKVYNLMQILYNGLVFFATSQPKLYNDDATGPSIKEHRSSALLCVLHQQILRFAGHHFHSVAQELQTDLGSASAASPVHAHHGLLCDPVQWLWRPSHSHGCPESIRARCDVQLLLHLIADTACKAENLVEGVHNLIADASVRDYICAQHLDFNAAEM
ncbi:uncharacterized protein Dvir_GJ11027, isoform C [Drosophila virilis]|uniref:Uncharacterized protein, isoform C n=1 Tax=Drosophila virilis TaxID=7244 RepID=A0A0Q9W9X8_DROVI|nr:uncharacterized protein Dvir_GJ11027, isoform C [Drosophila virilis]